MVRSLRDRRLGRPGGRRVRIAHLADLHTGFLQYHRELANGVNARTADVALAFRRAVDMIVEEKPDLVTIAGDLHHSIRPGNLIIVETYQQLTRLAAVAPVALIGGNHDTPRSVSTGSVLPLYGNIPGVTVAAWDVTRLKMPAFDATVTLVPAAALANKQPFVPDLSATRNILVIHGAVVGMSYGRSPDEEAINPTPVSLNRLVGAWDYIALGDYHSAVRIAANAWYSGSIEYTSTNPWSEVATEEKLERSGKGWLSVELGEGAPEVRFRSLSARQFVDLPPIDASTLTPDELVGAMKLAAPMNREVCVRQRVTGVKRSVRRALPYEPLRVLRTGHFHYQVDWRMAPEGGGDNLIYDQEGKRRPLEDIVAEALERRALPEGVDRAAFVAAGRAAMRGTDDERA